MGDVADDGDFEAFKRRPAVEDGAGVEESLRRVLVRSVAGVDDGCGQIAGEKVGGAGSGVAHDDGIGAHGAEGVERIHERLPLRYAGGRSGDGDGVGAEAFGGDFEAGAGARGGFEEKIHHHAAAKKILVILTALEEGGAVEDRFDGGAFESFDSQ